MTSTFQIVAQSVVAQRVTPERVGWFDKEVLRAIGPHPIAVARKRALGTPPRAAVVLVHGFGQNRRAFHLSERSFANYLAECGFDVFNVDLRGHGRAAEPLGTRSSGVDDYVRGDLPCAIALALERSGFDRVFLVGHSLGGLCAVAAGALHPGRVAGVVALAPPHRLGRDHPLLHALLRGAGHTVGVSGLVCGPTQRIPVDRIGRWLHATRFAWDSRFSMLPIRAWKPGAFSATQLREYIETSFDAASLGTFQDLVQLATTGELRSRADGTSYTALCEQSRVPLLVVAGSSDLLVRPGAVKPLLDKSCAADKTYALVDAGHGDMLVGTRAPQTTWPLVSQWLSARVPEVSARAEPERAGASRTGRSRRRRSAGLA